MTVSKYIETKAEILALSSVSPAFALSILGLIRDKHREAIRKRVYEILRLRPIFMEVWEND